MKVVRNYFEDVASISEESDTYTVPAGSNLELLCVDGSSGNSPDTLVQLIYDDGGPDEKILFATHGATSMELFQITALSGKTLKIVLKNDQLQSDVLGIQWVGVLVTA